MALKPIISKKLSGGGGKCGDRFPAMNPSSMLSGEKGKRRLTTLLPEHVVPIQDGFCVTSTEPDNPKYAALKGRHSGLHLALGLLAILNCPLEKTPVIIYTSVNSTRK